MAKLIETEIRRGVATLTFNRPNALNALNTPMAVELALQLENMTRRAEVGVIVLTGAGRAFMAGGDVLAMREALDKRPAERERQIGKLVRHAQLSIQTIIGSRKPVMACVNGVRTPGPHQEAPAVLPSGGHGAIRGTVLIRDGGSRRAVPVLAPGGSWLSRSTR